jgi:hypothetical protein
MVDPQTAALWAASDADATGSGAALERHVESQFAEAVQSGQIDPNDPTAVQSFLSSMGVTDEKGGGRFLFRKFTGQHGGPTLASRYAGIEAGARKPTVTASFPGAEMGRNAVMSKYGGGSIGALASPAQSMTQFPMFGKAQSPWGGGQDWRF